MKKIIIAGKEIHPGTTLQVNIDIAKLPSHTQINTPLYIARGEEDGPILALMAGMHGDEINGMEIVRRILDAGLNQPRRGTVLCMPIINIYGFLNYSRQVPDGKDINRSFPGRKNGSLASRVAYHIRTDVLPHIDYGLDFHTGGAMRSNYPQIRAVLRNKTNETLARAFCAPFTVDSTFRPNSLRKEASKKGKCILVYEGGESLRFDHHAIEEGIAGTLRLMKHLNMIDWASEAKEENRIIRNSSWVRAKHGGLFQPNIVCGQWITKGEWVGTLTDPFGEFKYQVMAPTSGYILGLNNIPVVNTGDALMHIGLEKKSLKDS